MATSPGHEESGNASSHPNRDRQSTLVMPPPSIQHIQSMAAAMAELTRQNQELTREIGLRRQHQGGHAKGVWQDELPRVLWAYRTTMRTPTGETPFKLAYGSEAVILAEVHVANHRVMKYQDEENEEQLHLNLDFIDEVRMDAEKRTAR